LSDEKLKRISKFLQKATTSLQESANPYRNPPQVYKNQLIPTEIHHNFTRIRKRQPQTYQVYLNFTPTCIPPQPFTILSTTPLLLFLHPFFPKGVAFKRRYQFPFRKEAACNNNPSKNY
jgi:hypothetical protein